jgi:hypothetical protein
MTASLSLFIPGVTRVNGIHVPSVIQIPQIIPSLLVYHVMHIIKQIWTVSTGVKPGMFITAHHAFTAILQVGQVNNYI